MAGRLLSPHGGDHETPGSPSRRGLLGAGAGLAAASLLTAAAPVSAASSLARPLGLLRRRRLRGSFEGLTEAWGDLAAGLLHEELTPDEYLFHLESEIARIEPGDVPERFATVYDKGGMTTGPAFGGKGFFLVVIELAPNTVVRPHDHPAHTVVTTLKQGSCRFRHFDRVGEIAADGARTLRCTRDGLLSVWESSEVSALRDNVHEFTAGPEGAVLLDFTLESGGKGDFAVLEVDEKPLDEFERTYAARIGEGF